LLSLIQVRKQRVEFMLKFFCCAHAGSIAQRALCVIVIVLRVLRVKQVLFSDGFFPSRDAAVRGSVTPFPLRGGSCSVTSCDGQPCGSSSGNGVVGEPMAEQGLVGQRMDHFPLAEAARASRSSFGTRSAPWSRPSIRKQAGWDD